MTPSKNIVTPCIFCGPDCNFGYGKCHCGCGIDTKICTMTSRKFRVIAGRPCRFILGHQHPNKPAIIDAQPFKIEGVYCRAIPLTRRQIAIVWESDYLWAMQWKWFAHGGKKGKHFYAVRHAPTKNRKRPYIYMHRELMALDADDPRRGDHKNHNGVDNRRSNLRPATVVENMQNVTTPCTNKSGYKGVSFHGATGKWTAQISVNGKKKYLGVFDTPEMAYAVYCKAAIQFHGEFACLL